MSHGRSAPLRVLVLVSATGANLATLLELERERPELVQVALVASDRECAGALDVAAGSGKPVWPGRFTAECGRRTDCRTDADRAAYRRRAREFHDRLDARIADFEQRTAPIDLVVLAYHRWIHGALLDRFRGRIINQHPGDLADLDARNRRTLAGLDPVGIALHRGDIATRTSTFFVDDTEDGGAIVVRGPAVRYDRPRPPARQDIDAHERVQKACSDRPALRWAVTAIAQGRVVIDPERSHADHSPVVLVDGAPTPLGGHDLAVASGGAALEVAPA